ncbi:MAG TPA: flagellar basal body-associated FliL family protein [Rhodospirillales bacterium]|nr:flagellar basal body-associated FliL family protein [Rhodospirillales bacterium]
MANTADEESTDNEKSAEAEAGTPGIGGGKRRLMLIAAGALLGLVAVGAGSYFAGLFDGLLGTAIEAESNAAEQQTAAAEPVFYALPEILVSLNTSERRSIFLKVKMSLEIADAGDQPRIERLLPRIVDYCHVYLRELRPEEVQGSAGNARLREELLRRIATAVAPVPVRDVLFNEMFVQ